MGLRAATVRVAGVGTATDRYSVGVEPVGQMMDSKWAFSLPFLPKPTNDSKRILLQANTYRDEEEITATNFGKQMGKCCLTQQT